MVSSSTRVVWFPRTCGPKGADGVGVIVGEVPAGSTVDVSWSTENVSMAEEAGRKPGAESTLVEFCCRLG